MITLTRAEAKRALREAFPEKRYELMDELSRGAQGAVWRVGNTDKPTPVVVKMTPIDPPTGLELDEALRRQYQVIAERNAVREAEVLKHFSASALFPTLYDARVWMGSNGEKISLLLEEELMPMLPTAYDAAGMTPEELVVRLGHTGCKAIQALADARYTYRDIKVKNTMLRYVKEAKDSWQVVFCDLGAAKQFDAAYSEESIIIGSPGHIAPERLRGGVVIAPRADVYSLGIMLLEVASGESFCIENREEAQEEIQQRIKALREQNPACNALYDLIQKMVHPNQFFRIGPAACEREWAKLLPKMGSDPEWLRSTARRALAGVQRGKKAEANHFMEKLPETDKRRFLLQAVLCQGGAARLQALRRAAVLGSPAACYYVAVALLNGDGISRDSALAMDYLKVAVDAGYPPACDLRKELQPGGTMKIPGTASSRIQYLLDEIAE